MFALDPATWQNVILIVTLVVAGFGAFLAVRSTRRASQAEVLYEVMTMLQAPDMREARRVIYDTRHIRTADPMLNQADVEHVCQAYGTVGMLLRRRYLNRRHFLDHHGSTILRVYDASSAYLEERARKLRERESWPSLKWMARRARRRFRWYRRHHKQEKTLHTKWLEALPDPATGPPPPPF